MPCNKERQTLWRIGELCGVFFCILGAIVALRWSSIVFPLLLNPDEVQAGANVLRGMVFGFNWTGMDGTTAGPLDSFVLAWPYVFGGEVTLASVRLTAALLLSLSCFFIYLSVRCITGPVIALALTLPLVLLYILTANVELLHYSSELFPVSLLTAANVLIVRTLLRAKPIPAQFFCTGFLLVCVPFAKLQATPLAVAMGLFSLVAIWLFYQEYKWRFTVQILLGVLTVPLVFFLPLLASGHLKEFWTSYILWGMEYGHVFTTPSEYLAIIASDPVLAGVSCFLLLLLVVAAALAYRYRSAILDKKSAFWLAIYSFLLFCIAIFIILKPGMGFLHYAHFYLPFLVLCVAVLSMYIHFTKKTRALYIAAYLVSFSLIAFALQNTLKERGISLGFSHSMNLPTSFSLRTSDLYSWIPARNDAMLVWGWMPQWYLLSGKVPATREAHIYALAIPSSLRNHFRARFMNDLAISRPSILLDAVTKTTFASHILQEQTVHSLEPLGRMVDANYTRFQDYTETPNCAKLYLENSVHQALTKNLLIPIAVTGPRINDDMAPDRLFDGSHTEDICKDYWLLPENSTEPVTVRFANVEPIGKVMLLNTRNGHDLDRAADKVRLVFRRNGVEVGRVETDMKPFPNWTGITSGPGVEADTVTLEVLAHKGKGGGLNEVKIFRR